MVHMHSRIAISSLRAGQMTRDDTVLSFPRVDENLAKKDVKDTLIKYAHA